MTKPKFEPETLYALEGAELNKLWKIVQTLYCDGTLPARARDLGESAGVILGHCIVATSSSVASYENWMANNRGAEE